MKDKKVCKIVEIPCEESSKPEIEALLRDYLVNNQDYINGNIEIESGRFEAVDVIIYDGCNDMFDLVKALSN